MIGADVAGDAGPVLEARGFPRYAGWLHAVCLPALCAECSQGQ